MVIAFSISCHPLRSQASSPPSSSSAQPLARDFTHLGLSTINYPNKQTHTRTPSPAPHPSIHPSIIHYPVPLPSSLLSQSLIEQCTCFRVPERNMPGAGSILRQLSSKEGWEARSRRWNIGDANTWEYGGESGGMGDRKRKQVEGLSSSDMYGYGENGGGELVMRKRVMVVVDQSSRSRHAMMWALTHVADKGDLLTLLHIIPPPSQTGVSERSSDVPYLASSMGSLCKASKPEVEVEALVIQGPKLATVLSQVKKLEASVLVLGQKKPSLFMNCLFGMSSSEEFVEQCINNAECLTIGVRKQSRGMGGYIISTRWQKNFWLLA